MSILITEPLNPLIDEDNLLDYTTSITPKEADKGDNYDSSDDEVPPPPSSPPETSLAKTNVPFSKQSKSSKTSISDEEAAAAHVFDHLTAPNKRASEILKNGKAVNSALNVVTTTSGTKLRRGSINLTKPHIEKKEISTSSNNSTTSKRGSTIKGSSYDSRGTTRKSSTASNFANDTSTDSSISPTREKQRIMNSSTGSEDEIPPPPPLPPPVALPAILSQYPVYRRLYSTVHDTYYFVDENTQQSIWEVPEVGIVISEDENSHKEYYTDCDTGIVAWTLDNLAVKIEEHQFS